MISITLKDSKVQVYSSAVLKQLGRIAVAINMLQKEITSGHVFCYSWRGQSQHRIIPDDIVRCSISGCGRKNSQDTIQEVEITTSHYVGQATLNVPNDRGEVEKVVIKIEPRMGAQLRDYLLGLAHNVYIPERLSSSGVQGLDYDNHWLLMLMWRCAFERAMKLAAIPKAYVRKSDNLRSFRGKINVIQHLQKNLMDQSKIFCEFRPLTLDTTINRTIRYVYRLIVESSQKRSLAPFAGLAEHDERLASFGVANPEIHPADIDRIVYTRMTAPYRPLMELSKLIIRGFGGTSSPSRQEAPSFFIDMAELWEDYLMHVFHTRLPEYDFVSPNNSKDTLWLFKDRKRAVRPDFFVTDRKSGELIAVLDAKYKHYTNIGVTASDSYAVSREDLFQMATYLYRFANPSQPILGLFISPYENVGNSLETIVDGRHRMGVCNLTLPEFQDTSIDENDPRTHWKSKRNLVTKLYEAEMDFAGRFRSLVSQ